MSAVLDPPTVPPRPAARSIRTALADVIAALPAGEQVLFTGLRWADYQFVLRECEAQGRRLRITYDRGSLAVMPTSSIHEWWKTILAMLVERYAEETGGRMCGLGNWTISKEDLDRGFMPDECYYIQNVDAILKRNGHLDLATDPPPDLAIEIEVSRSVLPRLPVMAAFKVPEVWRFDGDALTCLVLQANGTYQPAATSVAFPALPLAELVRFVKLCATTDQISVARQFRDWVRAGMPAGGN